MKVIKKAQELQNLMLKHFKKGDEIGLVPTMGALHEGHISLIEKSDKTDDITVVSIFVNPTQFGPDEDYLKYPRPIENDLKTCKKHNVEYVFVPSVEEMFPKNHKTFVEVHEMQNILCGETRKTHFRGVATVVAKLLNISCANRAYFGLKDFQQFRLIEKMAKDLNFPTKIIGCPLIREKSGLALSSRNIYLNEAQKNNALIISKTLKEARDDFKTKPFDKVLSEAVEKLKSIPESLIDYAEIRDFYDLSLADNKTKKASFLIAIRVGKTRLIDNIVLIKKK
jgi:pantoate--beta-alanine ligase